MPEEVKFFDFFLKGGIMRMSELLKDVDWSCITVAHRPMSDRYKRAEKQSVRKWLYDNGIVLGFRPHDASQAMEIACWAPSCGGSTYGTYAMLRLDLDLHGHAVAAKIVAFYDGKTDSTGQHDSATRFKSLEAAEAYAEGNGFKGVPP